MIRISIFAFLTHFHTSVQIFKKLHIMRYCNKLNAEGDTEFYIQWSSIKPDAEICKNLKQSRSSLYFLKKIKYFP